MTVETSTNKSGPYSLGGGVLRFPRTFRVVSADHVRVIRVENGVEHEVTTGFSQTGIGEDEGEVIFTSGTVPVGGELWLYRAVPNTQETDYSNQSRVAPERIENDLDLLEMQIQDLAEAVGRSLKVPISRPGVGVTVPGDGETIVWDEGSGSFVPGPTVGAIAGAEQAAERAEAAAAQAALYDGPRFDDVASLLYDTSLTLTPGQPGSVIIGQRVMVRDGAISYEVVTSGADITTAGGVGLRLVPRGDATDFVALNFDTTGASDMAALLTDYLARRPALVVKLPGGIVRLDSTVNVPSETSLDLANTKFDLSNLAAGLPALKAAGSVVGTIDLTANVARGATVLPLTSVSGIVPGTWLKLRSDAIFDPDRTSSKYGELCRVKSVSGLYVTLHVPLADSYTTATNARVEVLDVVSRVNIFGNADFDGGNSGNRKAIWIEKAVDCRIDNHTFRRFSDRAIWLQDCSNVNGGGLTFVDFDSPGTGYGLSFIDAAQDCCFMGISGHRVRHLVATNNTSAGGGIPRRIIIDGFHIEASAAATGGAGGDAMDTHAASEDIHFWNGTIRGASNYGVIMEGAGGSIKNVHIFDSISHGIYAANASGRPGRIEITGCTTQWTGGSGIRVNSISGQNWVYVKVDAIIEGASAFPLYLGINSDIRRIDVNATIFNSGGATQSMIQRAKRGRVNLTVTDPTEKTQALILARFRDCDHIDVDLVGYMDNSNSGTSGLIVDASSSMKGVSMRYNIENAQAAGRSLRIGAGGSSLRFDSDSINIGFANAPIFGTGSPEGVVSESIGGVYVQVDALPNAQLWVKEIGSGTTGWFMRS